MSPGVTRLRLGLRLGLESLPLILTLILIMTLAIILNLRTIDISGLS